MKKILFSLLAGAVIFGACRKSRDEVVSQVVEVSAPTISLSAGEYYSIPVGGSAPSVSATAFDSTVGESYPVTIVGADEIDVNTPGLYVIQATATNKFGYVGQRNVYVAVTNVSPNINLAGSYIRTANNEPVGVTKLANGLYETDDVGGAPTLQVPALFVHINDTLVDVPLQPTINGQLECTGERLRMQPGDTTLTWVVVNPSFGTAPRTFKKQ